MKKIAALLLVMAMLLNTSGCETENPKVIGATKEANLVIKPTVPYKDRIFIYNNGLDIEYKQLKAEDESKVKSYTYYPIILGLKNKEIQDKLNKEIPAVLEEMLTQLQAKYPEGNDPIRKYKSKNINASIVYNHNNVIFIDYNATITDSFKEGYSMPMYDYMGVGYDLNTGNRIGLSDLFKPGVDYKNKINSFISQYIIENNYDDYAWEMMTKPFQGIREGQSFSLVFEGLIITLDEKNDDFVYNGYPNIINIPLEYFGDDLYIFDKYFDEGKNIYERNKLTKKLFPNKIEFIPQRSFEDGGDKWHISITQGEFINIPDKTIEKKISAMLEPIVDVEKFKKEAKEYISNNKNANYYRDFIHNIDVSINAGGYLSIVSIDDIYGSDTSAQYRRVFNYDFNRKKEMKFMDLFINDIDVKAIIKKHIREMNHPISEAALEEGIKETLRSNDFSFSENDVFFRFSSKGADIDPNQEWIWMNFEEFGLENISLIN